ncbi:MAG: trigger factor [Francisella sp.]
MQVTVEKKEGIHCSLLIEVPADEVDSLVSKEVNKATKTIKMKGFRPGKVPAGVVKKKYGNQIRMDVIYDLIPKKYSQAIQDEKLKVAGIEVELKENKEGQPLKFVANLELFPEFEVTNLDKIEIQKPVVEITDKEVKQMIENIRKQYATFSDVDKEVEKDDKVTIDFVGKKDGETFDGGTANDVDVIIGSGRMIPGFEDGIIGMKKGETKTISLTFPEDYPNKDLAGANVTFDITVKKVQQPELPEINEDFAKKIEVSGGVENIDKEIKENMEFSLKLAIQKKLKEQVFKGLLDVVDFETPKSLIKRRIEEIKQSLAKQYGNNKNFDVNKLSDDLFEESATREVKNFLIIQKIIETNDFKVEDEDINNLLDDMVKVYEEPEKVKEQIKKNAKEMANIQNLAIENKIVDWVLEQAKVIEKNEDFFDLMRENAQI